MSPFIPLPCFLNDLISHGYRFLEQFSTALLFFTPSPAWENNRYPETGPLLIGILMAYTVALANSYGRLISELKRQIETVSQAGFPGRAS